MNDFTVETLLVGHVARGPILECAPDTTLFDAVAKMREANHGSILVVENGEPVGIWTVEDVIRLELSNVAVLAQPIAKAMSSPVKTIRKDAPLREASLRFRSEGIRHLLVIDATGHRVGVVSQTDAINNQGIEFFVHLRDVRSAMHADIIVVPAEMLAVEAIRQMRERKQDAVIVNNNGQYGVFTATDVLATVHDRAFQAPIGQLAHFPLRTVPPDASLFQARTVFVECRIRHLGVKDGDQLIGLLTYGDIMACVEQVYLREMRRTVSDQSGRLLLSQQALSLARAVAESTERGVIITDAAGVVESVNTTFIAMTGYSQEDAVGKNMRFLSSGRHDAAFFHAVFATLAERGTWTGELWNRRKDGALFSELLTITAVRGIDGAVTNYVGAFSNTTDERRQQEARLRASFEPGEQEKLYGLILDTLPISVFVKDETQHYLMVNDYAAAFIGLPKEQVRGQTDYDLFPVQTSERLREADQSVIDGLTHVIDENVVTLRGAEFYLLAHKRGVELGGRRLLIGASIDISSRRLAEQRLADEREILALIAANAGQTLILDTICQRIERFLHGGFVSILVLDEEGRHLRHGAAPNLPAAYASAVDGLEIGPNVGSCGTAAYLAEPVLVEDIAADPRWLKYRELAEQHSLRACWSTPVFSADHRVLGTFAIYFRSPRRPTELDLDLIAQGTRLAAIAIERARASATLHRMATVDALTGLPNRQHFFALAQRELSLVARNHQPLAAFMIDIDHFKRINDGYGHAAGDLVLRGVAGTISDSIRGTDVSGRLGGEEFVVLLPDTDQVTAVLVAERLRKRVGSLRFDTDHGGSCGATISIGIAAFREGDDFDRLLSRADEALYLAKNGGRDQVRQI